MIEAILLVTTRDWVECVKRNLDRVDVCQFPKPRKRKPLAGPGSIAIIIARNPSESRGNWSIIGEFKVTNVRYVSREEYEELKRSGRVCEPPLPKYGNDGKVAVIEFEDLRIYPREVKLSELCDVKTARASKPLCEWKITGETRVDKQLVEGIRRKVYAGTGEHRVGGDLAEKIAELEKRLSFIESLLGLSGSTEMFQTHECIERMLLELGKALGFRTYTADQSRKCGDVKLEKFADLAQSDLPLPEKLKYIDVIWHGQDVYYLFEVVLKSDMEKALLRFVNASELNARYYIVSDDKELFDKAINSKVFKRVRDRTSFISLNELKRDYYITKLWRTNIDKLKLPYLS